MTKRNCEWKSLGWVNDALKALSVIRFCLFNNREALFRGFLWTYNVSNFPAFDPSKNLFWALISNVGPNIRHYKTDFLLGESNMKAFLFMA